MGKGAVERDAGTGRAVARGCVWGCLFAAHAGLVAWVAVPPAPVPRASSEGQGLRVEWVLPPPPLRAPPPSPTPPSAAAFRPPERTLRAVVVPPDAARAPASVREPTAPGSDPWANVPGRGQADPEPEFRLPPATGPALPLRRPAVALPGAGEGQVAGIEVRTPPSPQDVVVGVGAMLFGGRTQDSCDSVRARLLRAGAGEDIGPDLERLRRLCR